MSELRKGSLNAGFNSEIQLRFQTALIPHVEKRLGTMWGDKWRQTLDERRLSAAFPVPAMKYDKGKLKWDTNSLLYAIREFGNEMPNVRKRYQGRLETCCLELLDLRNDPAHADPSNYDDVNNDRRLAYQASLVITVMRAFFEDKAAEGIEELVAQSLSSGRVGKSEIRNAAEAALPKNSFADDLPSAPAAILALKPVDPVHQDVAEKRRTPLPAPGRGVVVFPVVGHQNPPGDEHCLGSANATVFIADGSYLSVGTGLSGDQKSFYQIIKDTRDHEPASARLMDKTRVHFDFKVSGDSYGLATALADRSARYGLSSKFGNRRIIATGCIKALKSGDIGPIAAFPEKVDIVHRFAGPGTLFLFPLENLNQASEATRALLETLKDKNIEWRTVAHIDDLHDLLTEYPRIPPGADKINRAGKPLETAASHSASVALLAKPQKSAAERNSLTGASKPFPRLSRLLVGSAVSAFALMATAYGLSGYLDMRKQDIALVQASDEHLQMLVRSASTVQPGAETGDACGSLVIAAKEITQHDLNRFEDVHRRAMAQSKDCASLIDQSNTKLRTLVDASNDVQKNEQPGSVVSLAAARAALLPIDISRLTTDELKSALVSGDRALGEVKESDARIAAFTSRVAAWSRDNNDGRAADDAAKAYEELQSFDIDRPSSPASVNIELAKRMISLIVESDARINEAILFASAMETNNTSDSRQAAQQRLANLTDFDLSRLTGAQKTASDHALEQLQNGRWNEFEASAKSYRSDRAPEKTLQFAKAFSGLTAADRITFAGRISNYRDLVDQTQREILESDGRLRNVQSTYDALTAADKKKGGSLGALYKMLTEYVSELNEFDRSRLPDHLRAAVSRANAVELELAASDKRIGNAQVWAEIVLKAQSNGAVPRKVMENAKGARTALTAFDIERMTPEQKRALEKVCAVPVERPKLGVLPALAGFECYKPGDFRQKMLPAIR